MKSGIKTFPFSVDLEDDVKLVEAEFGLKGFAVVVKLYQAIYSRGYYMKWDIDTQLLFIRDYCLVEVGRNAVSEIVACCVRRGVFDKPLFDKCQILTSKRVQETFLNATKRSTKVLFEKEYALPIVYEFIENVNKNGKNVNIFFKNVSSFEQRKEKERKEEESIGKEKIIDMCIGETAKRFRPPTLEEVTAYCNERKNSIIPSRFIDFYTSKGWKVGKEPMKDWRAAIRTWEQKEKPARAKSIISDMQDLYRYYEQEEIDNGNK